MELLEQKRANDVRIWLEANTAPAVKIEAGTLAVAIRRKIAELQHRGDGGLEPSPDGRCEEQAHWCRHFLHVAVPGRGLA